MIPKDNSLSTRIKKEAILLGFNLAGVTTPNPPPHWPVFKNWLEMGRNASMKYMHDPRRADPRLIWEQCKSILMLGARYPNPIIETGNSSNVGAIAAYARVDDYHLVLPEKMKTLAEIAQDLAGTKFPYRIYTDTGPLLERDLGQRAGLGWIGKNTCLINENIGSFFFLAEILLGIELEPDTPFTMDRCGTCNRCIQACPTSSILPNRTIDSRRCISYLTIENKEEIPTDLRSKVGDWIFGCDICQDVCPWNHHNHSTSASFFQSTQDLFSQNIHEEFSISSQAFNQKFRKNPILRARRKGYLRNIAVVLGNQKSPSSIPLLESALLNEDPLIREHADWALGQIKNYQAQRYYPL